MIPGIIAWVRRRARTVINYLWDNVPIYPSVDVNPNNHLPSAPIGGFYGMYDSYDNHGRLLTTGSNSAIYVSTIVKFNSSFSADRQYLTTDFIHWKHISIGYPEVCKILLYGNGVYVAFGSEDFYYRNHFYYSQDDGSTWNLGLIDTSSQTGAPITFEGRPNCGIFASGKFIVFLEADNKFLTSVDGINWTVNTFLHPAGWFDIIYRPGYYLVYSQDWDRFLTSTNGVDWSLKYSGRYVRTAVATETSVVLFTPDGSYSHSAFGPGGTSSFNRTVPLPNTTDRIYRARYGNGRILISLTDSDGELMRAYYKRSFDGLTWTDENLPTHESGPISWLNIYFTASHFRAVGWNQTLKTFTAVNFTGESEGWVIIIPSIGDLNDIAIVNDKIILAGNNKLAIEVESVSNNSVVTASIQNQIYDPYGVLVHENYDKVAYGNGIFIYLCINSRYIIASQTFQFQTGVRFNITAIGNIYQLFFSNNLFYIIGSDFVLKSSDGVTWNQESLPVSDYWQFAKTGNNIILLIGQSSTIYSLDGSAWLTTTRPIPNVYACEFWDGKIILTDALSDNIYITTDAINYNQFSVNGGVGVCSGPIGFIDSTVYQGKLFATFVSTTQAVIIKYSYDCQNWDAGSSIVVWRPDGSTETPLLEHTYKFFAENEGKLYAVPKQLNPASGSESWRLIEKTAITPPVVLTMVSSGQQIFSVANTAYATVNTLDITVQVSTGQVLKFGTCNLPQASTIDDTYIKLIDPTGLEITDNDDFIDYASYIEVTAAITGDYILRIGGYSDTAASGTVAWETYNVG